jgi:hypothetical protein
MYVTHKLGLVFVTVMWRVSYLLRCDTVPSEKPLKMKALCYFEMLGKTKLVLQCNITEDLKANHCCANLKSQTVVWHFEDSVTVCSGIYIGSTLLEECTVFVFRPKYGGNVSVWDIGTCPPDYISGCLHKIVKSDCYVSHVRLCAWNNLAPTEFDVWLFFGNV